MDDIRALQPTVFIGVPRVFDRIYSTVLSSVQVGNLSQCMFPPYSACGR